MAFRPSRVLNPWVVTGFQPLLDLPSVLPVTSLQTSCGLHRFEPVIERCRHRPGQCYLPDKEFRLGLTFVFVQKCTLTGVKQRVPFTLLLHVAMQMGLYLHQRCASLVVSVWRVVSEDSDHGCDQPFLLIDCTGWVVTWRVVPTRRYHRILSYSSI